MGNNYSYTLPDTEVRRKNIENSEKLSQQDREKDRNKFVNEIIKSYNDGKTFVYFAPEYIDDDLYCTKLEEVMGDKIDACSLYLNMKKYYLYVRFKDDS